MRSSLTVALFTAALWSAAPLQAQANAQPSIPVGIDSAHAIADTLVTSVPSAGVTTVGATLGASLTGMRSAVHKTETRRSLQPTIMATRANLGQARALMIVGAAAFITGAIIEGDAGKVFMVGGAIVGLYGLYEYLQ